MKKFLPVFERHFTASTLDEVSNYRSNWSFDAASRHGRETRRGSKKQEIKMQTKSPVTKMIQFKCAFLRQLPTTLFQFFATNRSAIVQRWIRRVLSHWKLLDTKNTEMKLEALLPLWVIFHVKAVDLQNVPLVSRSLGVTKWDLQRKTKSILIRRGLQSLSHQERIVD